MKAGHFTEAGKSYQITTPVTPTTWENYLFQEDYHMGISQTLQGKSSVVRGYERTSYTTGERFFYLADEVCNQTWNPNYVPLRVMPEQYACVHGLFDTKLTSTTFGIETVLEVFVPQTGTCEVWSVTIKNTGEERRTLSLYTAFGLDDHGVMGGACTYEKDDEFLYKYSFPYHVFYEDKEKVETIPSYTYFFSDVPPVSYDCSKTRFWGSEDTGEIPAAVGKGSCSGIKAEAEAFLAATQHTFVLESQQSIQLQFQLGIASDLADIRSKKARFTKERIQKEREAVQDHWDQLLGGFSIETPDENLNSFVNYHLKKQITLLTRQNRGSVYCPIRNQLQDAMGYAMVDPKGAKEFMFRILCLQESNGGILQWHLTDGSAPRGLCLLHHTDGPLWLILCISALVRQLGEHLYEEKVPYQDGTLDTVYGHLLNAVRYMTSHTGAHGLCLMGDGDWNDPINGVGRLGRGESTWNTLALIYGIQLLTREGGMITDPDTLAWAKERTEVLIEAVNTHCWCGSWYCLGFDDEGRMVGGTEDGGHLFLNAQTWAVMSGAASGERLVAVEKAIERLMTPFGPLVLAPPFQTWNPAWGRISVKQPGTTENGSVYCHASMFLAYAHAANQDGDALYDVLWRTLPTNALNPMAEGQLPLYIPNYYFGLEESENYGRSSGHYGTGTVAWMLLAVVEELLGVKAYEKGLMVRPLLPGHWDQAACVRTYKDATYRVTYTRGKKGIYVNQIPYSGTYLPYEAGHTYMVEVGI